MSDQLRPRPAHHTSWAAIGRDDLRTFRLWVRRGAHEYPAFIWSTGILALSWAAIFVVPSFRKNVFGYQEQTPLPTEYPVPAKRNAELKGYDDP